MRDPADEPRPWPCGTAAPPPSGGPSSGIAARDRLHTGDAIAMAHDALTAYRADVAAGKDALLVCDTTEMSDALNRRLHDETIDTDAPTVTAARGHRIGVGDLIISRRNDPTIGVYDATDIDTTARIRCATATAGKYSPSTPNTTGSPRAASTTAPAPPLPATTCASTSPTATPSPCTRPRASPPSPPTPCSAKTPAATCCTSR